jgi:hypothetical protein
MSLSVHTGALTARDGCARVSFRQVKSLETSRSHPLHGQETLQDEQKTDGIRKRKQRGVANTAL